MLDGGRPSVTVYLHNIGWGSWYWHFQAVPGYDYATELARAGHASLVYDNLDYGASDRPAPTANCYGSEADVASQVIGALRAGGYSAGAGRAPRFAKVALAAHSIGSLAAEPESYSFKDADALVVTSWADQTPKQSLLSASGATETRCAQGGEPGPDGSPSGYASFSAEDFRAFYFANADPRVADAATAMRTPVPCGEPQSAFQAIGADRASLGEVTVPVLLAYGRQDALFPQPDAGDQQKALFTGSRDVTEVQLDGAGQALALERTAPAYRRIMAAWLAARGF
jgi:pimeloyl-ACP methyl ester carboxylesterase